MKLNNKKAPIACYLYLTAISHCFKTLRQAAYLIIKLYQILITI